MPTNPDVPRAYDNLGMSGGIRAEDRKSLAVRLTYRNPARTLTDEELAPVRASIAEMVAERLGGVLRTA